jgi:hypothetical protein
MSESREDAIYMAKLAEQAERYDDMVTSEFHFVASFLLLFFNIF